MKIFSTCILILFCVFSASCTKWPEPSPKRELLYTNSWQNDYKKEILSRCHKESAVLALANFEARGRVQSREEVVQMEKFIMDSCLIHFKVVI